MQKNGLPTKRYAAAYVRMSTDHQKYSIDNQMVAIREYADKHNIEIIKTYNDSGKSGLTLSRRKGLQTLLSDIEMGSNNFSMLLVLDVSRWGRFQDADESAHYEYMCRRAGIEIQYVAEQFHNDGSPMSTIIKGLKRAMAGEYSRELSVKVYASHCYQTKLGYRQGAPAGYTVTITSTINGVTTMEEIDATDDAALTTDTLNFEGHSIAGTIGTSGQTDQYGRTYTLTGDTLIIAGSNPSDTLTINNFLNGDFGVDAANDNFAAAIRKRA